MKSTTAQFKKISLKKSPKRKLKSPKKWTGIRKILERENCTYWS